MTSDLNNTEEELDAPEMPYPYEEGISIVPPTETPKSTQDDLSELKGLIEDVYDDQTRALKLISETHRFLIDLVKYMDLGGSQGSSGNASDQDLRDLLVINSEQKRIIDATQRVLTTETFAQLHESLKGFNSFGKIADATKRIAERKKHKNRVLDVMQGGGEEDVLS